MVPEMNDQREGLQKVAHSAGGKEDHSLYRRKGMRVQEICIATRRGVVAPLPRRRGGRCDELRHKAGVTLDGWRVVRISDPPVWSGG